jgi:hypothetical protein
MAQNDTPKGLPELITALAAGSTVPEAAKTAGISLRTAYRWLEDSELRAEIALVRARMIERAAGKLAASCVEAAEILAKLARSAKSETIRLSAARSVLEQALRLRESLDIATRLAELERYIPNQADPARFPRRAS